VPSVAPLKSNVLLAASTDRPTPGRTPNSHVCIESAVVPYAAWFLQRRSCRNLHIQLQKCIYCKYRTV